MSTTEAKLCTVYGLRSSLDDRIRYVGQTYYNLKNRLTRHIQEAKSGNETPRSRWIRKTLDNGGLIEIFQIEENAVWNEAEIKWISYYRGIGTELLNITSGGQGAEPGVPKSEETRMRMKKAAQDRWLDPVFCERTLAGLKLAATHGGGYEVRRRNLEAVRQDPEKFKAIHDKRRETVKTEEFRQKMREHATRQMSDPEMRKRIASHHRERFKNDPEARKKSAEGARKGWADPEKRAKRIEAMKAAKRRGKPNQLDLEL